MKCAYCGEELQLRYQVHNKKRYHKECYSLVTQEANNKAIAEREQSTRLCSPTINAVKEYVCNLYGIKTVPHIVEKQIEDYVEKYSIAGVLQSLQYYHSILGKPKYEYPSIGIVPYVYQEAQDFYRQADLANATNKNRAISNNETTVRISRPDTKLKSNINLEDI